MVKVLLFSFEQCCGPFTMLLVRVVLRNETFTHLSSTFLPVCKFKNMLSIRVIFFFFVENVQTFLYISKMLKKIEKQTVLRFFVSPRETFSTSIPFAGINKYGKGLAVQLWTVCWHVYHVTYGRVVWNETFLDTYLTTFFGVRKFKNTFKLWWSSFSEIVQNWI